MLHLLHISKKLAFQIFGVCLVIALSGHIAAQDSGASSAKTYKKSGQLTETLPVVVPIGSLTAAKFISFNESLTVDLTGVRSIQLTGIRSETVLTKVLVRFSDGTSNRLYSLEGRLPKDALKQNIFAAKNGTSVEGVEIAAFTPKLTGPRGKIMVRVETTK